MQLPGATPPSPVGATFRPVGAWGWPNTPLPPTGLTRSLAAPPQPAAPPTGVARSVAMAARPPAYQPLSRAQLAANPPMPPVRPQDQVYSPLQAGNIRGGAPPAYTSVNLGDILNRLFGRA
jgi:hypothetical protein